MKDQIYNIEPRKLIVQALPTFMRTPLLCSLLFAAVRPELDLCRYFSDLRGDVKYKLQHNGQTCYLQAVLNDALDGELRRIKIEDAQRKEAVVFYPSNDEKPVVFCCDGSLGKTTFYPDAVIGVERVDFIVRVPVVVLSKVTAKIQLKNLLDYYKLASKRYTIIAD